jgi:hypothetical protein
MANNLGFGSVNDWYANDLGRQGETGGLDYWNHQLELGIDPNTVHNNFETAAAAEIAGRQKPAQQPYSGITPATTNLSAQYASMGASDPTSANAKLLSGQVNNPYLDAQAQNIQTRLNRNLNENIMPSIGQGAIGAGQYGSSRQGIAQGKAIADTQDNYAGQMANLYGSANENAQNRMAGAAANLSGIGAQVGMANAAQTNSTNLQNQGQMQNFYLGNRQLDQSGMQLGASLYGAGNTGNTNADTSQTTLGTSYQNAPLTALQNYSNTISPYTGLGGTQSTTQTTGGGAIGTAGGALAGSQIYKNLGFGSTAPAMMDYPG